MYHADHTPLAQVRQATPDVLPPSNAAHLDTTQYPGSLINAVLTHQSEYRPDVYSSSYEALLSSYYNPQSDASSRASSPSPSSSVVSIASQAAFRYANQSRCSLVDYDVHETIRQLEEIADELRALDSDSSEPSRSVYKHPPLPRNVLGTQRRPPSPTFSLNAADESDSVESHDSASSSSSGLYHAPILNGALAFTSWHDRDSRRSSVLTSAFGMTIPRIMITIPSSDELADESSNERCSPRDGLWRRAGLWDGEPDEVQWLEEYGQWSRRRRDPSGSWSDSDSDSSDSSSVASSLFISVPETSSASTSPPTSPISPRDSPPSYESQCQPPHARRTLAPIIVPEKHLSPIMAPVSHPALWLCHIVSKPFLEHKYRKISKLRKKPSSATLASPNSPSSDPPSSPRSLRYAKSQSSMTDTLDSPVSPVSPAFSEFAFPLKRLGEHENTSSWSLDTFDRRQGWGSLGRLFKRGRS